MRSSREAPRTVLAGAALAAALALLALSASAQRAGHGGRAAPPTLDAGPPATADASTGAASTAPTTASIGDAGAPSLLPDGAAALTAPVRPIIAPPRPSPNTCVACHATQREPRLHDPVEAVRGSVHGNDAISCAACHGGRPNEPTVHAHDLEAGFVARPSGLALTERCGACHADARFIRRYRDDLQTDQLALYRGTRHGVGVATNNAAAPTCVACHGSHDIRPVTDPGARVAPRHVADTCGGCHADAARMAGAAMPTTQLAQWRNSVHGVAVLEHNNARAPTCAGCHGGHGEYREAGGAESRCRRCHEDEAGAFDRSPHAGAYRRLGFSGCVACHGSHDVRESATTLASAGGMGVCRRCHAEGQRSFEIARRIASNAEDARRSLAAARAVLHVLDAEGLSSPAAAALVDDAASAEVRLRVALHALDENVAREAADAVRTPAARAQQIAQDARRRHAQQSVSWLLALPVFGLFALLALVRIRQLGRNGRRAG